MAKIESGLQKALVAERKKRLCHASYWQYTGNHPNGKDCPRSNPYGFPLHLIAYARSNGGFSKTEKGDEFGREVSVAATKEDWEKMWIDAAIEAGQEYLSEYLSEIVIIDGWAYDAYTVKNYSKEDWEIRFEVFLRSDDESILEMVQKGYAPLGNPNDKDCQWMQVDSLAKV